MSEPLKRPGVGVGVYVRKSGKILFMLRKSAHGQGTWCAPGGHLEMGEPWEACARREVMEETGLEIENVRFLGVTNDIFDSGKHYVTIAMGADWKSGEVVNLEPEKCERAEWFKPGEYPEPLFLPARNFLKNGYNPLNF